MSETPNPPALRMLPKQLVYRVELTPAEVLERLRKDPEVQVVSGFPARKRSGRKFLAEIGRTKFRVCQNVQPGGALEPGPAAISRLTLEADLVVTPRGTLVRGRLMRGPLSKQASFYVMWAASFLWLGLTGVTAAKLGLVAAFLLLTVPAFVFELARQRGTDEDRIELLNLMAHLLGPSVVGDNPEENMPYRHGRRLPPGGASAG
ncbi:MAG: hypothetical protein JNL82_21105 [Myxococcales bacterium]|nr:hypothetical protein [Myxococcales bacterium]